MIARRFRASPRDFSKDVPVRFRSPYFIVKVQPNREGHPRFAVIVPSAAIPTSVRRHQLKRWILARTPGAAGPGMDILFVLGRGAASALKRDIAAATDAFIRKL